MVSDQERKRSEEMRSDWEQRIASDYRFWMSDGVASDEVMWETGKRDLASLLGSFAEADTASWRVLDVGCGVGRLIKAAAPRFAEVLGADISETAIAKAKTFLAKEKNVSLERITGVTLQQIDSDSLDAVYSFAVLGHIPTQVFVAYLLEINRALRLGGKAFLQIYLGREQQTVIEDTLAVRSYDEQRLRATLTTAGFGVCDLEELVMPFDARDVERGIFPFVLRIEKIATPNCSAEELQRSLVEISEESADAAWPGSRLEYQMSITRVHQLIAEGKLERAREMLEFAVNRYKDAEDEAYKVLRELQAK